MYVFLYLCPVPESNRAIVYRGYRLIPRRRYDDDAINHYATGLFLILNCFRLKYNKFLCVVTQ
jgi:hypothetical protein